jgi:hypothetical protein
MHRALASSGLQSAMNPGISGTGSTAEPVWISMRDTEAPRALDTILTAFPLPAPWGLMTVSPSGFCQSKATPVPTRRNGGKGLYRKDLRRKGEEVETKAKLQNGAFRNKSHQNVIPTPCHQKQPNLPRKPSNQVNNVNPVNKVIRLPCGLTLYDPIDGTNPIKPNPISVHKCPSVVEALLFSPAPQKATPPPAYPARGRGGHEGASVLHPA